jgi:hypothetical protein
MIEKFFLLVVCGVILVGCASATLTPVDSTLASSTGVPETETEKTAQTLQSELTTPELIDVALSRGRISATQRLLYLAYAIYEPDSLPEEYRSNAPWHGTMAVKEIYELISNREKFCAIEHDIQQEFRRLIPESVNCSP